MERGCEDSAVCAMSSDKFTSRVQDFNKHLIDAKNFKETSQGSRAIQSYNEARKIYDLIRQELDTRYLPNNFASAVRGMETHLRETFEKMQQTQYTIKSSETLRRLPE